MYWTAFLNGITPNTTLHPTNKHDRSSGWPSNESRSLSEVSWPSAVLSIPDSCDTCCTLSLTHCQDSQVEWTYTHTHVTITALHTPKDVPLTPLQSSSTFSSFSVFSFSDESTRSGKQCLTWMLQNRAVIFTVYWFYVKSLLSCCKFSADIFS